MSVRTFDEYDDDFENETQKKTVVIKVRRRISDRKKEFKERQKYISSFEKEYSAFLDSLIKK